MPSSSTADSNAATTSATTSLTQSIEKLDGSMESGRSNYQAWKFRVIRILKEKGLLTAIEEDLDKNDSKAMSRDNAAFPILTLNVRDTQITHIQECSTAKEAWEALRIVHQGIGASGRMVIMQRLWALRMLEGGDMAENLNRFRELASQVQGLSGNGKAIDENELVTLLSLSLPDFYEPIIMALQSRTDDLTFNIFAGRLLQESARRLVAQGRQAEQPQRNTSTTAFTANYAMRGKNLGGRYGLRRGGMRTAGGFGGFRTESSGSNWKGVAPSKAKGKCFYCQKEGHWKRDCNKRKADEGKDIPQATSQELGGIAFTVLDRTTVGAQGRQWIVDSGASQHLCGNRSAFTAGTYQEITPRAIEIADQSKIQAVGIGIVRLGELELSNVLLVPQLGGNLLSVARMIDSGYEVRFTSAKCAISKSQFVIKGKREGNLYYIREHDEKEVAHLGLDTNKSMPETLAVWHRRLGHRTLDYATIEYLTPPVSEFNIKRSGAQVEGKGLCGTCAVGRQHKEAATGSREKAQVLLQVVHSDICGPMQVSTITGERYFITFIDEKSGRIAVTLLKSKNEALGAFQAYQVRPEREARKPILTLRTDGGGEYTGQLFQNSLQASGIAHAVSPPYTPNQNATAERANRTSMEGARCMLEDSKLEKQFWGFAVATAAHIHNRLPSRSHKDQWPLQHWTGEVSSIGHLWVFGSITDMLVPAERRKKLDSRSTKGIFVGYDENAVTKTYRIYDAIVNRVISSRDVIIDELATPGELKKGSERGGEIQLGWPELGEPEAEEEDRG